MKNLVKQGYDRNLVSLGFYPAQIEMGEDANGEKVVKTLKFADIKNDKELHFELDDYHFDIVDVEDFKDKPKQIGNIIKKDKRIWFDKYEIAYPVEDDKPINQDPFLLGIKDGKRYLISSWNTEIWDREVKGESN